MTTSLIDPDTAAHLDSLLLQRHRGDASVAIQIRRISADYDLTDDDLDERLKAALARKASYAKSKQPRKFKAADGEMVAQVDPAAVVDRLLTYSKPGVSPSPEHLEDLLNEGGVRLPLPHLDRRHRDDGQTAEEFEYLLSVLRDLHAGKLQRGKVAYLAVDADDRRTFFAGLLPVFSIDALPMNFDAGRWTFVRRPGQTQAQLDKAIKLLDAELERQGQSSAMSLNQLAASRVSARW